MVNDKEITPDAYAGLLESIKREITGGRTRAEREAVQQMIKDPYTLDFADNGLHERALDAKIAENITRFLQELGTGFAFVGRQYPLIVDGDEFFVDLLFYHLKLRRYVAIELKSGRFVPESIGKLSFYVAAVDTLLCTEHDEPTVGILLVAGKSKVQVEFTLRNNAAPIAVSTHTALPQDVLAALPSAEELAGAIAPALREDSSQDDEEEEPL